jgi:cytosine/adenosine deaminase-related metal-dependent hydrolase
VSTLLRGATLVEIEPPTVERADLRIEKGKVTARGPALEPLPNEEVTDLSGRVVMPGLVSAHHHLHGSLLRGLVRGQSGFAAEQALFERVEEALSLDDIQAFAASGGLEGLCSGTTTVFAVHASPKVVGGSLGKVAHGLNDTGIRGVLAYELSDRAGVVSREESLEEMTGFIARARGRFRGAVGLSHLAVLSNEALQSVKAITKSTGAQLLVNIAEDAREESQSQATFGATPLERLIEQELVTEKTVLAQGVHFSWPQLSELLTRGAWLVHAARSNMNTQTGMAAPAKFGVRACLGTDVMSLDTLAEAQVASLRSRDAASAHRHSARHRQRAPARVSGVSPDHRPAARRGGRRSGGARLPAADAAHLGDAGCAPASRHGVAARRVGHGRWHVAVVETKAVVGRRGRAGARESRSCSSRLGPPGSVRLAHGDSLR